MIVLDLRMPVMDAWRTRRALRAYPATAVIPVIAHTAEDHQRSLDSLERAGFAADLRKPCPRIHRLDVVGHLVAGATSGPAWIDVPVADPAPPLS